MVRVVVKSRMNYDPETQGTAGVGIVSKTLSAGGPQQARQHLWREE